VRPRNHAAVAFSRRGRRDGSAGIGAAAGWIGGGETVVDAGAPVTATDGAPTAPGTRPLVGNGFDPAAVYESRADGVVTIYALFPGHDQGDAGAQAQGSGFVVDDDGTILTNSHVITTVGESEPDVPIEPATQVYVGSATTVP
jgi:S1-C subfamily serine protease